MKQTFINKVIEQVPNFEELSQFEKTRLLEDLFYEKMWNLKRADSTIRDYKILLQFILEIEKINEDQPVCKMRARFQGLLPNLYKTCTESTYTNETKEILCFVIDHAAENSELKERALFELYDLVDTSNWRWRIYIKSSTQEQKEAIARKITLQYHNDPRLLYKLIIRMSDVLNKELKIFFRIFIERYSLYDFIFEASENKLELALHELGVKEYEEELLLMQILFKLYLSKKTQSGKNKVYRLHSLLFERDCYQDEYEKDFFIHAKEYDSPVFYEIIEAKVKEHMRFSINTQNIVHLSELVDIFDNHFRDGSRTIEKIRTRIRNKFIGKINNGDYKDLNRALQLIKDNPKSLLQYFYEIKEISKSKQDEVTKNLIEEIEKANF